jgi:hypothetical protein
VRVIQPNGSILLGEVIGVSDKPYSLPELSSLIESDWVFNEVLSGDYNYYIIVELDAQLQEEDMVDAVITVDHVRPIALMISL